VSQHADVTLSHTRVQVELPSEFEDVLPGVKWGAVDAFPSPAYWMYQVIARRLLGAVVRYRLGESLKEEVAACILGGHGVPADVGVAAFLRLKALGSFDGIPTEHHLLKALTDPLVVGGRAIRYRFARQKARYLSSALRRVSCESPPVACGRELRDWLLELPGVGYKTASWIARNWLDADDVAILDIHIMRAGALGGFLDARLSVQHHYLALEAQFLKFSRAIGVLPSELDAVMWIEMAASSRTVRGLLIDFSERVASVDGASSMSANIGSADPH
jgi:N-glycosylase/DNA lyase